MFVWDGVFANSGVNEVKVRHMLSLLGLACSGHVASFCAVARPNSGRIFRPWTLWSIFVGSSRGLELAYCVRRTHKDFTVFRKSVKSGSHEMVTGVTYWNMFVTHWGQICAHSGSVFGAPRWFRPVVSRLTCTKYNRQRGAGKMARLRPGQNVRKRKYPKSPLWRILFVHLSQVLFHPASERLALR